MTLPFTLGKSLTLPEKLLFGKNYEYGFCAPEFYPIPETEIEQAVFQSGVWLPEWERFYLIRCLYSSTNQKNRFLGWKVQLLKDIGNGKELSHPIWAMNEIEEEVLETVLMDKRIFSKEDLEQANTRLKIVSGGKIL